MKRTGRWWLTIAGMGLMSGPGQAEQGSDGGLVCDNQPVLMVVAGLTHDPEAMGRYGKAIRQSGLYAELAGYYLNDPRPVAVFEGEVPDNYVTLMVRFPCLAHAKAFWNSRAYQEEIKPIRTQANAGTYTVTVYREIDPPPHMAGRLEPGGYAVTFGPDSTDGVAQAKGDRQRDEPSSGGGSDD